MRNITFFISGLRGGGAERVCVSLANGMAARGHAVEVVVLDLRGDVYSHDLSPVVKLTVLGVRNVRSSFIACSRFLRKTRPEVILSFNRQLSIMLIGVRMLLRLNFRLVSRNIILLSEAQKHKKGLWHGVFVGALVRRVYPKSDFFVAQSHEMKDDLVKFLGIPESIVAVIHNPVNSAITNVKSHRGDPCHHGTNYILCVGRLESQKNHVDALKAFAAVAKLHPGIRLKVVGEGSLRSKLEKCASSLGIAGLVDFEGFTSNIVHFYLNARMTVLTSLYEGFPNVLVESIAVGTPVVSYDCPSGPKEIIDSGVNGFLVPLGDEKALVRTIDEALTKRWTRASIIKTSERFGLAATLDKYLAVLLS